MARKKNDHSTSGNGSDTSAKSNPSDAEDIRLDGVDLLELGPDDGQELLEFENSAHQKATIKVIGVGGGGGNAINTMIEAGLGGVEFVAANTDAQALAQTLCDRSIQLGRNITQGLGAGSRPDIGRAAAEVERRFRKQGIRPQLIPREGGGSAFRVYQARTR